METNIHIQRLFDMANIGKIPHAILLENENLNESMEVSKRLIKQLFCNNIIDADRKNAIEVKIEKEIHPDVNILKCEGKSKTIGVNQIREIKQDLYIKPNEALYKVYIIEDAGVLTIQSQNALLKILEEPPYYAVFILMCKSCNVLLQTIISRVQKFSIKIDSESNEIESSKETLPQAQKIVESFFFKKELKIMEAVSKLTKDRKLFKNTVYLVMDILNKAILLKNCEDVFIEPNILEIVRKTYESLSETQIFEFIKLFKHVCFLLDSNVNINLIVSYLSIKARELAIL